MTDTTDKSTDKPADKPADKSTDKPADKPAPKVAAKPKPQASSASKAAAKKPKPAAKKSGGGGFKFLLIVVLIVGGSVIAGWPIVGPYVSPQLRPYVEDVRARLGMAPTADMAMGQDMSQDMAAPEVVPTPETAPDVAPETAVEPAPETVTEATPQPQEPEPTPTPAPSTSPVINFAPAIQSLATRLDVLEGQLGAVSNSDGQTALAATGELAQTLNDVKAQLTAFAERLDALDQAQAQRADSTVPMQALVLAATQLRARLMNNASFVAELTALERIAGNDEVVRTAVNHLRPHAEVGVPSEATLIARFAPVAVDIIRASKVSGDQGWMSTVKDSLSGLITVRRTDPSKITNAVERAVAEAEAALQLSDLPGAVQALSVLQGPPGDAAAAWLGDASARADAEAALDTLHNHALEALAQASGG